MLVCPFTTYHEPAAYCIRIDLPAGDTQRQSWVMVDKLMAIKRERIGAKIASSSAQQLKAVEHAMTALLGLGTDD